MSTPGLEEHLRKHKFQFPFLAYCFSLLNSSHTTHTTRTPTQPCTLRVKICFSMHGTLTGRIFSARRRAL
uniref:Uncharacterized protein n=1 Tax=Anopheles dirus TaxID=7168 RepID=A0A182NWU9_9DIPT